MSGAIDDTRRALLTGGIAAPAPAATPQVAAAGEPDYRDYLAIQRLYFAYAFRIDSGNREQIASVMPVPPQRDGSPGTGPAEGAHLYSDGTPRTQHVTTDLVIEFEGPDRATGKAYYTVFQQTETLPLQCIITGLYRDRFEKSDGIWRMTERKYETRLWGDLTRHQKAAKEPHKPLPGFAVTPPKP
jgi:hypothetical protein